MSDVVKLCFAILGAVITVQTQGKHKVDMYVLQIPNAYNQ